VLLVAWALIATTAIPAAGASAAEAEDQGDVVATRWGELGPADRDFLAKVRQAGLWELPTGQQAMEKSDNPKVRQAGMHLIEGHSLLDRMVRDTAAQLQVSLPDQPNSDQQGWLAELAAAEGTDYEQVFANRLRAAHGKVYGFAAQVRAGTRNTLVRTMATQTMTTVFDHMQVLEETGLVRFGDLPSPSATPPSPGRSPVDQPPIELAGAAQNSSGDTAFTVFAACLVLVPAALFVVLSQRGRRRRR
jgi:predicted outer membrane protein